MYTTRRRERSRQREGEGEEESETLTMPWEEAGPVILTLPPTLGSWAGQVGVDVGRGRADGEGTVLRVCME